jgi:putative protease
MIENLRSLGIASLKIEGRMRSAEYVSRVVRAYRLVIDHPNDAGAVTEAQALLAEDWAREKTMLFYGKSTENLFDPSGAQCMGRQIGAVVSSSDGTTTFTSSIPLVRNDRLRFADPVQDTTKSVTLKDFQQEGTVYRIALDECFAQGAQVFKAGDASWDDKRVTHDVDAMFKAHTPRVRSGSPRSFRAPQLTVPTTSLSEERRWIRIDNPEWLPLLSDTGNDTLVLVINHATMHRFKAVLPTLSGRDIVCELTPWINQRELPAFRQLIETFVSAGMRRWILNNIGHLELVSGDGIERIAGQFLYTLNAAAAATLQEAGFSRYSVSWEDDRDNIDALCRAGLRGRLLVWLFGYPPLLRSKMITREFHGTGAIAGATGMSSTLTYEAETALLLPDQPVALFNEKPGLLALGVRDFGVDLSHCNPDPARWSSLKRSYTKNTFLPTTTSFNFRRSLA